MALTPELAAALANPCLPDEPPVEFAVVRVREQRRRVRKDSNGNDVEVQPRIALGVVQRTIVLPPKNSYVVDWEHALIAADGAKAGDVVSIEKIAEAIPDRELLRLERRKDADPAIKNILDRIEFVRSPPVRGRLARP